MPTSQILMSCHDWVCILDDCSGNSELNSSGALLFRHYPGDGFCVVASWTAPGLSSLSSFYRAPLSLLGSLFFL